MKLRGWLGCLGAGLVLTGMVACDTATVFGTRPKVAGSPEGETPAVEQTAGGTAPAPIPDGPQQVRALEERIQQLERRLAELESRQAPTPTAPGKAGPQKRADKPKAQAPPAKPAAPESGREKVYSEAWRLYQAKNFKAAREKFALYLQGSPPGPKAVEARYYLGDSFYQEKKYQEAKTEFSKVVSQHPQSILAPPALLRQAYSYQQLQQNQNYQAALKKLIQKYPQSPEAREARKLLKPAKPSQ